jgi:hypothetical protein
MCIQCQEVLDRLYTKASKRVYLVMHCFRPTLASLFSLSFFAHFQVPLATHSRLYKGEGVNVLAAYDCMLLEICCW